MVEPCLDARWACERRGGLLVECVERPEGVDAVCKIAPDNVSPTTPRAPYPAAVVVDETGGPVNWLPWVVAAAIVGVAGYYVIRR